MPLSVTSDSGDIRKGNKNVTIKMDLLEIRDPAPGESATRDGNPNARMACCVLKYGMRLPKAIP